MLDALAPYIYIAGMFASVLLVGTTALMAGAAPADAQRPTALALISALITWATLAWIIMEPLPVRWLQSLSLSMWVLLSVLGAVLLWFCRPPAQPEPPAAPPPATPTYPRINGRFVADSSTDVDADLLRRNYRKKST